MKERRKMEREEEHRKVLHLAYYFKRMFEQANQFLDEFIKEVEQCQQHNEKDIKDYTKQVNYHPRLKRDKDERDNSTMD